MPDAAISDDLMTRYPLPPVPEAQPSDLLGAFFGAAPDRTKSYAAGLDAGSQYRLRSAQGEKALEEARVEQTKRIRGTQINDAVTRAQADPSFAASPEFLAAIQTGANDMGGGLLKNQEHGNRNTFTDPNATVDQQYRAGNAIHGQIMPQVQALGAGREINVMDQTPYTNPLGASTIALQGSQAGAADALTDLRTRTDPNIRAAGAGGPGGAARLPVGALKIVDEATQAMSAADQSEDLAKGAINTLQTSGVNLGLADNLINRGKNFIGDATPESKAYASVDQTFQKLRNNYLLLAKGVQTEGDAIRAWNSEIGEAAAYDNGLAEQQLNRALALIDMQRQMQKRRIEGVYTNYGQPVPGMYNPQTGLENPGAPAAPAATGALSPAEQAELEQLRAELGGG